MTRPGEADRQGDPLDAERGNGSAREQTQGTSHAGERAPTGAGERAAGRAPQHVIERTRTSAAWMMIAIGAVILLIILTFIAQNRQEVEVQFFGLTGTLSLGVALSFAAVVGAIVVLIVGAARILQLRWVARRHRDAERPSGDQ